MGATGEPHPLTLGLYNTVEQREPIELEVTGSIPEWLEGCLYRGAGGRYDVGQFTSEHWFDGFSRMYRFDIAKGKVTYRSRNTSDEMVDFIKEHGGYPGAAFFQDPCKIILGALESTWRDGKKFSEFASAKNVGVDFFGNWPGMGQTGSANKPFKNLVATTDANELMSLDVETMEPLKFFTYDTYDKDLIPDGLSSAHPSIGLDGSLYQQVTLPTEDGGAEYKIFELNPEGKYRLLATITDAPASYIHQISGTENFVVMVIWQAHLDFNKMVEVRNQDVHLLTADFSDVIDKKKGGIVAKYTTDPFYTFHAISAFEDPADGSIVVDLPWMPNYDYLNAARIPNLRANVGNLNGNATHDLAGTFRRYRLPDVHKGGVQEAKVDFQLPYETCNIELPQLNNVYRLKSYRYAYGVHVTRPGFMSDSLIKIDVESRTPKVYCPENDSICSEPIFVATPGARAEDDGVLLSVVMDSKIRKSSLAVIDAKEMVQIGRAELPHVMGYGFHGTYAAT